MGRPVVHFEIGCKDKTKTAGFYAQLFDWKITDQGLAAMIAAGLTV
jgi:predicted enzyme related to lactoylglutathione lyase